MNQQSGKTLVETLSVLAIMAVLSLMGITGYYYASSRYQANNLIHIAHLAYVDLLKHDNIPTFTNLNFKTSNGTPLQGQKINNVAFILAKNVDAEICERLVHDKTTYNVLTVDNQTMTTCLHEKNDMIFDFGEVGKLNLSCQSDTDCKDGKYCSLLSYTCIAKNDCSNTSYWDKTTESCLNCPTNATTTPVDGNQIENTPCYCLSDFSVENNMCVDTCGENIINAGFDNTKYTIIGKTITYHDNMLISKKLDLDGCNLIVQGALSLSYSGDLIIDNLTVTGGTSSLWPVTHSVGIYNSGLITASTITTQAKDIDAGTGNVYSCGIFNNKVIHATTITSTGKNAISTGVMAQSFGIYNNDFANITADTIVATANKGSTLSSGIHNKDAMKAFVIKATGLTNGFVNSSSYANLKVDTLTYCPDLTNEGQIKSTTGTNDYTSAESCS